MKNGASSLLWFASLQFPFHSVQAVVCARHCENTLTIFSGFGDLFSYVLNLIFFSFFFSIKVVQRFQLFFFPFLFSSWCICRHTVSLVSKMWCIMHVFSSGLEWEEQQRDGELWEVGAARSETNGITGARYSFYPGRPRVRISRQLLGKRTRPSSGASPALAKAAPHQLWERGWWTLLHSHPVPFPCPRLLSSNPTCLAWGATPLAPQLVEVAGVGSGGCSLS